MKKILSITLGSKAYDFEMETKFLDQSFHIKRIGTDGDVNKAADLLYEMQGEADAIGIGNLEYKPPSGLQRFLQNDSDLLKRMISQIQTPTTTGETLRKVAHQWTLHHIQHKLGNYFNNTRVLFFSGLINNTIAEVMSEYTDNLVFADLLLEHGIPKFLNSLKELKIYLNGFNEALSFAPTNTICSSLYTIERFNRFLLHNAMKKADAIVIPNNKFFDYINDCTLNQLGGKTIITSTVYDDRLNFLRQRNVDVVIDTTPKVLERVVGFNVLEAMIIAALNKPLDQIVGDDFLEIICENRMDPRIIYPSGKPKRVNKFAFITHPISKNFFKEIKSINILSKISPKSLMNAVSKLAVHTPPFIYSKVSGIKSPKGVEAEGWIISVGGTSEEMQLCSTEFINQKFIEAAKFAKSLGAQIVGVGPFYLNIGDAADIAKKADIPVTTGISCAASVALWAAADAVRRLGIVKKGKDKILHAKTMVVGAIEPIGSVCCRLLAKAFEEVNMIDTKDARLLALRQDILQETPDVKVHIATRADKFLKDMDVIVIARGSHKNPFDIMNVKPGCVITDMTRPLSFSQEEISKRPDILYIKSGEILLPGNPEMKDIGLPPKIAYAELAETIILALEARFEVFSAGDKVEWQKVREIYRMGLKHGMKLAAISGVSGVTNEYHITNIRELALNALKKDENA